MSSGKKTGHFLVRGLTPQSPTVEHFGELHEVLPKGFKSSVLVGCFRYGGNGTRRWAAIHFPTGLVMAFGVSSEMAVLGATRSMLEMKVKEGEAFVAPEDLFQDLVAMHPIINTSLTSPYKGPTKMQDKV
jgi:hypothetical protein